MTLQLKQKVFVEEYLKCFNATQAALKAGYSEKTARSQGSRLLTVVDIQTEIQQRLSEKVMSADEVLTRLTDIARNDLSDYIDRVPMSTTTKKNGDVEENYGVGIDIDRMKEDQKAHLIKSVKENKFGTSVEFNDPMRALELIGKHHKLFVEKTETEHTGNINLNISGLEMLLDKVYGNSGDK